MSIVSSNVEQSVQADGGTHNVVRMVDHLGNQYMQSFFAGPGYDVDAKKTQIIVELEQALADAESRNILGGN